MDKDKQASEQVNSPLPVVKEYRPWTEQEVTILKNDYSAQGAKIKSLLGRGRTTAAIQLKAQQLGLRVRAKRCVWTDEAKELLKKEYPENGTDIPELVALGFRPESIKWKATKLKLKLNKDKWTDEELETLKKLFPSQGTNIDSLKSKYSRSAIQAQASKLGLSFQRKWTTERKELLKEKYPALGGNIPELLNEGFKPHSIEKMASRLGVRRNKSVTSSLPQWSEEEINIIRDKFKELGSNIPELINKYKTSEINKKARELGFFVKRGRRRNAVNTDTTECNEPE